MCYMFKLVNQRLYLTYQRSTSQQSSFLHLRSAGERASGLSWIAEAAIIIREHWALVVMYSVIDLTPGMCRSNDT